MEKRLCVCLPDQFDFMKSTNVQIVKLGQLPVFHTSLETREQTDYLIRLPFFLLLFKFYIIVYLTCHCNGSASGD